MTRPALTLLCLAAALSLSGCGKLGALERPGPSNAPDVGPEPSKTVRTVDPRNRNSDPSPTTESAPESASPK